jgi:mannose-6-phosphate isomerase-like protein (cupin superfamily)
MAETLKLTPKESVTIRQSSPEVLEVEGSYGPRGKPPPAHYHPGQDEHFEISEGTLRAKVGGEQRDLGPGEVLDIPRGTPHQMWNPGDQPARVIWQTTPALRTAGWFRSIDALHSEGRVGGNGMPGPLAFGALLSEYDDVFRLAGPRPLVKAAVVVLGALGRARGYKPGSETFSDIGP